MREGKRRRKREEKSQVVEDPFRASTPHRLPAQVAAPIKKNRELKWGSYKFSWNSKIKYHRRKGKARGENSSHLTLKYIPLPHSLRPPQTHRPRRKNGERDEGGRKKGFQIQHESPKTALPLLPSHYGTTRIPYHTHRSIQ